MNLNKKTYQPLDDVIKTQIDIFEGSVHKTHYIVLLVSLN